MDVSFNSPAAARHPRLRSTGRTPTRHTVVTAHRESARAIVTLALCAYGLVDVVEDLAAPWAWLVQALVLALLARSCLVAARHSHDHRVGWLLSGSVAAGLAIAAFYNLADAAATPVLPLAGLLVCIAILLVVVRSRQHRPHRGQPASATSRDPATSQRRPGCHADAGSACVEASPSSRAGPARGRRDASGRRRS